MTIFKRIPSPNLLFGYFFLAAEEKVTGSKGFESKLARRPVSAAHTLNCKIKVKSSSAGHIF
jgi:hypothetical protein